MVTGAVPTHWPLVFCCISLLSVVLILPRGLLSIIPTCIFKSPSLSVRATQEPGSTLISIAQRSHSMFLRYSYQSFLFTLCFVLLSFSPSIHAAPSAISRYEETIARRQNANQQPVTFTTVSEKNTCVENLVISSLAQWDFLTLALQPFWRREGDLCYHSYTHYSQWTVTGAGS